MSHPRLRTRRRQRRRDTAEGYPPVQLGEPGFCEEEQVVSREVWCYLIVVVETWEVMIPFIFDQLLLAICDPQKAVLVHVSYIARAHPFVAKRKCLCCGFRVVLIPPDYPLDTLNGSGRDTALTYMKVVGPLKTISPLSTLGTSLRLSSTSLIFLYTHARS